MTLAIPHGERGKCSPMTCTFLKTITYNLGSTPLHKGKFALEMVQILFNWATPAWALSQLENSTYFKRNSILSLLTLYGKLYGSQNCSQRFPLSYGLLFKIESSLGTIYGSVDL